MRRTQSIGSRLTASFFVLFSILIGFGIVGLIRLDKFKKESADIRDHWLKNTRYLGDLSNYTSDFRAMEASALLLQRRSDIPGSINGSNSLDSEIKNLDEAISRSRHSFESVAHDKDERRQYEEFIVKWKEYRADVESILSLIRLNNNPEAVKVYLTSSSHAFSEASELLERLTEHNNLHAEEASDRAAAAIREAWLYISISIVLSGLTVLIIMLSVMLAVSYPLRRLSHFMNVLSQGEMNFEIVDTDRRDELGEMARAVAVFKSNAIELKLSQRGLASQAKMLEEKLAHERRLNQQQRNFISMASHEFRTPMTIIDGHAQRLINSQEPMTYENSAVRAKKIRMAIRRMSVMIDNILQSSKLIGENPELYLHPCEFDMRALLHEVCKIHRQILTSANIYEDIGYIPLPVFGDKDMLFQVFNNLVANAVKYSPDGGMINVKARVEGNRLIASVRDEGIGIPEQDIGHLFECYFRGSNVKAIVGTGVGLFFVKNVIELHHGNVNVSKNDKKGSTFTVDMPCKA
jgi:signal transduction histidine kinase